MKKEEIISHTYEYVKEMLKDNDIAHDFYHVERVIKTSFEIASNYKEVDIFLLHMLALLHDIDDDKLASSKNAFKVKDFLKSINCPKEISEKILSILPKMSFRKYPILDEDFPIEGKIVVDADRLDAIGAIGIARVFSYSSFIKRPFYSKDENENTAIKHFDEKLLILHNYLNTKEAKKMAIQRHKIIKEFYDEFLKEVK